MVRKLVLLPEKDGYGISFGAGYNSATLESSASVFGKRPNGAPLVVDCTWLCDPVEYAYLRAFYRTSTALGSLPFLANLAVGAGPLEELSCIFEPGSFTLRETSGNMHKVSARLIAVRRSTTDGDSYDEALAMLLSEYGSTAVTIDILQLIEELANEDLRT